MQVKFCDNEELEYPLNKIVEYHGLFEHWYKKVSRGGRLFTRYKARPQVISAHAKHVLAQSMDKDPEPAHMSSAGLTGRHIKRMLKADLQKRLAELELSPRGTRQELRTRLANYYKVVLDEPGDNDAAAGKHKTQWKNKEFATGPAPFLDDDFNRISLAQHLPSLADGLPTPAACWKFYFTEEMVDLGISCTNSYPKYINSLMVRPPWTRKDHPWPPTWVSEPHEFTKEEFMTCLACLFLLGLKNKRRSTLRQMFGNDPLHREDWLKALVTRRKFEAFLRQLHFEDADDVRGEKFAGSVDYRPNLVPKVGLLLECCRRRCVLFRPGRDLSYDEATARYGGRMTKLKHLQSKYKPYDGVRIYSLNESTSGYTQNFRVDLRDGTSIAQMMASVMKPFEGQGYNVWADNAFVSVATCIDCKAKKINFAGTTRTTFGFPPDLIDETLPAGSWRWQMSPEGILAAYWADVGFVKLMSNWHGPEAGQVLRRVEGQADKVERESPLVGEHYNGLMGGTDLNDFLRSIYTTARISKKWWKCLFFWCMDASMINAFVLHKYCWKLKRPGVKYKYDYPVFVRRVCSAFIEDFDTKINSPPKHGRFKPSKRARQQTEDYHGPNGEDNAARVTLQCPGAELERSTVVTVGGRKGRHRQRTCRYCWNANSTKRVRRETSYQCSACKIPLCPTCTHKYHKWVNHY